MRALRVGDGTTSLVEVPEPEPRGEALVRVVLSGICNTDLELARGYAGFRGTIGHEVVGVGEDPGGGALAPLCAMALAPLGPLLVGKHPEKLALADARGIETALADEARRRGRVFDAVVEASGGASGFELALDLLRPQGTLVLKSTFHGQTPIDAARIVVEEIRVVGSRCGRFAPALDLLARGAVDVGPLISEVVSLDRGEDAMRRAAAPGVLKVLLSR